MFKKILIALARLILAGMSKVLAAIDTIYLR